MLKAEFGAALTLLTRLPYPYAAADPSRCVWAYPLIGAGIGGIGAAAYCLCWWARLPPPLCALWTLAVTALVTGGLHEDGLADMADGFGGGGTVERKLEIMRDSPVGSYGVLALVLSTAIRGAAIAELARPELVTPALVAAGALSRGLIGVPVLMLRPVRDGGLGASLRERGRLRTTLGPALAACIALALLPPTAAFVGAALGGAAAVALGVLARAQIGGYTGDVLGGCAILVECVALSAVAAG